MAVVVMGSEAVSIAAAGIESARALAHFGLLKRVQTLPRAYRRTTAWCAHERSRLQLLESQPANDQENISQQTVDDFPK